MKGGWKCKCDYRKMCKCTRWWYDKNYRETRCKSLVQDSGI